MPEEAKACIECHKAEHPGIFSDWARSRHASAGITCLDCHQADPKDKDVSTEHYKQYERRDTAWGKARIQDTRGRSGHAQGLFGVATPTRSSSTRAASTPTPGSHLEARSLAEQGHEFGQRAQDRLPLLPRHRAGPKGRQARPGHLAQHGRRPPEHGRQPGQLHQLPHAPPASPSRRRASPRPAASATWARTIRRSKYTPSPSTGPSTTPRGMNGTGRPPRHLDTGRGLPFAHVRLVPHVRRGHDHDHP